MEMAATGAVLGATGGLSASFAAPAAKKEEVKKKAALKISCQEGVAPGDSLNEKLDFLESLGIVGIEPGAAAWRKGLKSSRRRYKTAISGSPPFVQGSMAG